MKLEVISDYHIWKNSLEIFGKQKRGMTKTLALANAKVASDANCLK